MQTLAAACGLPRAHSRFGPDSQVAHTVGHRAPAWKHDAVSRIDDGGVAVMRTVSAGATCSSALATERRLPIP
jgi:hypothetical protein